MSSMVWGNRIPWGLLGTLVLILAVEVVIEWRAIDLQGGSHWSCRIVTREASTRARKNQILYFGDSLVKLGLMPNVIEAETGLRGYNLAQTGGQAPGSYILLRRALESGARPAAIVVDFFPAMLALETSSNDENWPFLADLTDVWELAKQNGDPGRFTGQALRWALPSLRSQTSIRTWVYYLIRPNPKISIREEVLKSIRNWQVNRGAEVTKSHAAEGISLDGWEQGYFGSFRCLPIHRLYVERFLDLAARDHIPVFWLLPPYQPALWARTERSGFDRDHTAFVRQFLARYPNLIVLDVRRSDYPAAVFHDFHHLGVEGAVALSRDVGTVIKQTLRAAGSRNSWLDLPTYRIHRPGQTIETTDDSMVVIRREVRNGRIGGLLR